MTPETINVLLNLLKQVNVSVMAENADGNYESLKTARDELFLEQKASATVKKKVKEPKK